MTFKERLAKLIDVKSIVTLVLVATLVLVVVYSMFTGKDLNEKVFMLFSNVITMIITYFFTKKQSLTDTPPESTEKQFDE